MTWVLRGWRYSKGEGCGEGSGTGWSGPVGIIPFIGLLVSHLVPCLNERPVSDVPWCLFIVERAEGGPPPCAGVEAENFQHVDLFFAFVLKVR